MLLVDGSLNFVAESESEEDADEGEESVRFGVGGEWPLLCFFLCDEALCFDFECDWLCECADFAFESL